MKNKGIEIKIGTWSYDKFFDGAEMERLDDLKKQDKMDIIDNNGKCPKDGRKNRPVYITYQNKRTLAVADGDGHAYKVYGEGYDVFSSVCKPENKYNPSEYEFERGLSGMDF